MNCFITILFSSDGMKSIKIAVGFLGLCSALLLSACNGDDSPKETEQSQVKLQPIVI